MAESESAERNKALMEFRAKHFKELKKCLKASIAIRDDPEVPAKDRNTAIRNIASMLGALTERGDVMTKGKAKVRIDAPEHDALKAELDALIDGI